MTKQYFYVKTTSKSIRIKTNIFANLQFKKSSNTKIQDKEREKIIRQTVMFQAYTRTGLYGLFAYLLTLTEKEMK